MSRVDARLGSLARIHLDGVPLDLASALLPWRSRLRPGLLAHIHLHARGQKAFARVPADPGSGRPGRSLRMGKPALLGLVRSLAAATAGLRPPRRATEWGGYYGDNSYSDRGLAAKREIVARMIDRLAPASLWDFGANTGPFSRLASDRSIPTLSFDIDHSAVEANYREMRAQGRGRLLPLVLDVTNPSPALGWENRERASLLERGPADACMALALIHHLAIANNLPLGMIARFFAGLCRGLILEFVPKSDVQVKRMLSTRADIFPEYHEDGFRAAFAPWFRITESHPVPDSDRMIHLLERAGG
jgi:hypothetical protein